MTTWIPCPATILEYNSELSTYECKVEHPHGDTIVLSYIQPNRTIKKKFAKNDFVMVNVPFEQEEDGILYVDIGAYPEIIREYEPSIGVMPEDDVHKLFGLAERDPHNEVDWNTTGQCGIIKYASGKVYMGAGRGKAGANPSIELNPSGVGINMGSVNLVGESFNRYLGNTDYPVILDQFAKYYGNDDPSDPVIPTPNSTLVAKRSFVPRSLDASEGYVSTCEGADAIFVGANNGSNKIEEKSSALFRKYIYDGSQRLEIVAGDKDDPNESFLSLFLNDIGATEKARDADTYSPAVVTGNKFFMHFKKAGGFELGTNPITALMPSNFKNPAFRMNVDDKGETTLQVGVTPTGAAVTFKMTPDGTVTMEAAGNINIGNNIAKQLCNNLPNCLFTGAPHTVGNKNVRV